VFCVSVWFFFLRFSISWVTSSLTFSIFIFNSFISLFILFSVSFWCLFRAPMSSFICSCVFSYSLFLVSWNFLSASCMFWLTVSRISPWNSRWLLAWFLLWRCFCRHHWVPWCHLSLFCWGQELGIHFTHFPLNPVLSSFLRRVFSIPFASSHCYTWYCAIMFLIGSLVVLETCFLSLDLFFVLLLSWFLGRLVCCFCPWSGCNLVIMNSQIQYPTRPLGGNIYKQGNWRYNVC
jgi:hypothetical protein